jgi:hypothetical protein
MEILGLDESRMTTLEGEGYSQWKHGSVCSLCCTPGRRTRALIRTCTVAISVILWPRGVILEDSKA